MELHAVGGMFPVCQRHDLAVLVTCRHFQAGREVTLLCDQGVISAAGYHRGQIGKERTVAVQCDLACLAVHQVCCTDDRSAERLTDGLVSQTHAQHGELSAEAANRLYRDAGILGIARPRREDQRLRCQCFDLRNGDLIVPDDFDICVQFADVLIQVIRERIVVINEQDHCSASLMALITASALLTVS